MENLKLYITLAVLVFMVISFLLHKISFGLTTMTAVAVLFVTGVIDIQTAFSGFSHTTTILVATMLVIAGAFGKTSVTARVREKVSVIQGKGGIFLVLLIILFTMVLGQLLGQTAVMSIMLMIILTLDDSSEISQSRMLFLCCAIISAGFGRVPIGMGAIIPISTNAYYEGLLNGQTQYLLGMFDILKVGIIPSIALTVYTFFAWRLIEKKPLNNTAMAAPGSGSGSKKEAQAMSKTDEIIVLIVFAVIMLAFCFSTKLGDYIYIIPFIGILILLFKKILTAREVSATVSSDIIFMLAGIQVFSKALASTGAGEFVGNLVLHILGDNPSGVFVIAVFAIATTIMTNFLSNNTCVSVMVPIAASTALAGGMNPKSMVLVVFLSSCLAVAFPTGCASAGMAYSIGEFDPIKTLKFSLPYLIIGVIAVIFSVNLFYPIYG